MFVRCHFWSKSINIEKKLQCSLSLSHIEMRIQPFNVHQKRGSTCISMHCYQEPFCPPVEFEHKISCNPNTRTTLNSDINGLFQYRK
jgi:hypothetical protein